jgi:hypothetical protein
MKTVWKYELEITDKQIIQMPTEAEPLYVGWQHKRLCVWMLVDPATLLTQRIVRVVGTGHPVTWEEYDLQYAGTAVDDQLGFVWHVWVET